jgi:hypothetical protein
MVLARRSSVENPTLRLPMSEGDSYRRRAEALLSRASQATDMAERGRLIDEALHWHKLAMDAAGHPDQGLHDNDDEAAARDTGRQLSR